MHSARVAVIRAVAFSCLWLLLAGAHLGDLPGATVAVAAATWISLRTLPPRGGRLSLKGSARLLLRLPHQVAVGGVDVARRALDPRLPIRPGLVSVPCDLPRGPARQAFCALTSLVPGTVPAGEDDHGALLFHSIDTSTDTRALLARELAVFRGALAGDG